MPNDIREVPKECAYCGETEGLEEEHVIPKAFNAEKADNWEPILVWACTRCNREKGRLDETLRDLFTADFAAAGDETAELLKRGKVGRAVKKAAEKDYKNALMHLVRAAEPMEIVGADGDLIIKGMGAKLPFEPLKPWFRFVVKGITMALSGERMTADFDLEVLRYYKDGFSTILEALKEVKAPPPVPIGKHTMFTLAPEPGKSFGFGLWVFQFYGGVVFSVYASDVLGPG